MRRRRSQLTIAAVAFALGLLVVVQLRSQAGDTGLAQLSAQDLTVLVANLNDRNDDLRTEAASLDRELATLVQNRSRGDVSVDEISADLERVRAYAGLDPVTGPGVTISIDGPIDGPGVEELINELRNAGAEAIAIGAVRVVTGVVVTGGPGAAAIDGVRSGRVRGGGHRRAGQADRLIDPIRRRDRAARRHPARRGRHGHPGRPPGARGDDPDARPRPWSPAPLIP